jgi:cell division protein FtsI (penicillin-binding protein 3)
VNPGARLEAIRRLTWLGAALLVWGVAILGELISLQILHHGDYVRQARKQQEASVDLIAPRGTIFDRDNRPLAMSEPVESVLLNPRKIPDKRMAADLLGPMLSLDADQLYQRMLEATEAHRGMVVKRAISPDESQSLHGAHLTWIRFEEESKRTYPNENVASHVIGSVYKGEHGAEGIEKSNDELLRGVPGKANELVDVQRHGIESWVQTPPVPGKSIRLSIDQRLQFITERELAAQVVAKHGRTGSAIIMNPYTGEILAFANYPSFDPNKPPTNDLERRAHFNLGAQVPFEPGSVFKVLTLATALETTTLRPTSLINCHNGILQLPGRVIHEAHGGFGMIPMADVLAHSSNIGAIEIGAQIGREKFYEYLSNFGFGQRTGSGLPAESPGILRKLDKWRTTSLASVSMGQEVAATSLQLVRACAVMANGGMLVTPHVILDVGGQPVSVPAPRRVLRPETTVLMRQMMEGVVLRGTGKNVIKLHGWSAGGKTGTAQIFEHGHYTHLYNASFMGFAPLNNPALVAIVTINGTEGNLGMGGSVAGPVWSTIMNEALRLYDVPKDVPEKDVPQAAPAKVDESVEVADIEGDLGQNVLEDDPSVMPKLEDIPQVATAVGPVVPDFRGKSMRAVATEAYSQGISVTPQGSGVARNQSPAPGTPLHPGEAIRVLFTQ